MICKICNNEIKKYNLMLNNFKIDDSNSVDICLDCTDKFLKWQGNTFAKLFPTTMMKKRFNK